MTRDAFFVTLFTHLRMLATTATAIGSGLFSALARREPASKVALRPGDRAPEFALQGSDGRVHRVSEYVGRQPIVLAWFPKAFTGGCTAECASIGLSSAALARYNVAYFGASVDTPETNRRFAASLGIDFPILSDPDKTAARAYGVLGVSGFPARWTFYIGMDGRILAIDTRVRAATHGNDIVAVLETLNIPTQNRPMRDNAR